MVDSRSSSLSWGMRDHSRNSVGEEMSQMQSGSYQGEGESPIPKAKRERGLRRLRESPGIQSRTLRTSLGAEAGIPQEVEGEEAMEGSEVHRLRDLWNQDPTECQVLSALLGGSERSMASTATFCSEKGERSLLRLWEGSSKGGSGLLRRVLGEENQCSQANLQ